MPWYSVAIGGKWTEIVVIATQKDQNVSQLMSGVLGGPLLVGQSLRERPQSPAAVTYSVFLFGGGLTKSFAQLVTKKKRIVANPAGSPRRFQDPAGAVTLTDDGDRA